MSDNASSVKIRLVITSTSVRPEAISEFLGVAPSKTWLQGEAVTPRATNVREHHGWVRSRKAAGSEPFVGKLIDQLIDEIPGRKLLALHDQYGDLIEIEISIVASLSPSESVPSISLSPKQIGFLAACNGSVDVDLYVG